MRPCPAPTDDAETNELFFFWLMTPKGSNAGQVLPEFVCHGAETHTHTHTRAREKERASTIDCSLGLAHEKSNTFHRQYKVNTISGTLFSAGANTLLMMHEGFLTNLELHFQTLTKSQGLTVEMQI